MNVHFSCFSIQINKAIVYIEEMDSVADVTFPAVPQVVSLLLYDDTAKSKGSPQPPNGYPVVCVTVWFLPSTFSPEYNISMSPTDWEMNIQGWG